MDAEEVLAPTVGAPGDAGAVAERCIDSVSHQEQPDR